VFSNWPTSKTPLKYVWSMDFSPKSRYMAIGNDHGKCLLYRLKHYWDE
jgi:U3 small nucleolar RNA-associated protein 18